MSASFVKVGAGDDIDDAPLDIGPGHAGRDRSESGLTRAFVNDGKAKMSPGWKAIAKSHGMKAPIEKSRAMFASKGDLRGSIPAHLLNLAASFAIAARCIFSGDAILGCLLCSAYTMLYWHYGQEVAVNMNWTIVSLAVVFPISQGIGMGFKRVNRPHAPPDAQLLVECSGSRRCRNSAIFSVRCVEGCSRLSVCG